MRTLADVEAFGACAPVMGFIGAVAAVGMPAFVLNGDFVNVRTVVIGIIEEILHNLFPIITLVLGKVIRCFLPEPAAGLVSDQRFLSFYVAVEELFFAVLNAANTNAIHCVYGGTYCFLICFRCTVNS